MPWVVSGLAHVLLQKIFFLLWGGRLTPICHCKDFCTKQIDFQIRTFQKMNFPDQLPKGSTAF